MGETDSVVADPDKILFELSIIISSTDQENIIFSFSDIELVA
ncbi:MAG: hypothetical protein Q8S84_02480 [bacterium]|nr:hypothetical protein [bacterium]MDP3380413.1 hypothetical protein [bacterium]